MSLLEQYLKRFKTYPPKLMMTHYEDNEYQELLKEALEDDIPITKDDVDRAYKDVMIDRVQK